MGWRQSPALLYKCFLMALAFQTFIRFDLVCMLRGIIATYVGLVDFGFHFVLVCFSEFSYSQQLFFLNSLANMSFYLFFENFFTSKLQIKRK